MRLKLLLVATAMVLPGLAMAQSAPAQPPAAAAKPVDKSAPTAVEGVVVTSDPAAMRTAIDRRSYSVANDLSARTGSIADALRNIPSVEVDVQGNVSLRGDANVTILIDGKPSGQFNGDGKADNKSQRKIDETIVLWNDGHEIYISCRLPGGCGLFPSLSGLRTR